MGAVSRLRAMIHRPYVRAAVTALALAAAAGGLATVALELSYGVPGRAVVRYFFRLHDRPDDLVPLLRQPATLSVLDELAYASGGINAGGLVYSLDGRLTFHPWMPAGERAADRRSRQLEALYFRLLTSYFAADLDRLIAELSHPETRRQLGRLGVAPTALHELRRQAAGAPTTDERRSLLRQAGDLIRPLMPAGGARHHLGLADKLRFYADRAPRGRYLGLYEVRGPRLLAAAGPVEPLPDSGRLLLITKQLDGSILVEDLRPERRRSYRLTPISHPAGLPLYRIARRI